MTASEQLKHRPWYKVYRDLNIGGDVPPVEEKSLADYVEKHARDQGDLPALEYLGITINYRELDRHANRFANLLKSFGLKKGDVIGLHLPNIPQYMVGLVGAAKVGVIVSGVSPLLTASEIVHQVNDAGIKVLLTLDQLYNSAIVPIGKETPTLRHVLVSTPVDFLPGWKKWLAYRLKKLKKVVLEPMADTQVHDCWSLQISVPSERVYTQLKFDDILYVQYTGGTTGKPKGAELTLHSMFSNARQAEVFNPFIGDGKGNKDTVAAAFPLFHMAGLSLVLISLQNAARFLLVPNPRDVAHFCAVMQKYPPTMMANVPTLYMMLMDTPEFRKIDFSNLRIALSGAAPFPVEEIRKLESVIGEGKMCEVYGMTEASPLLTSNCPKRTKVGTVGIPVVGTDILIVDVETGKKEMKTGEPGEIIACGPQLMRGYRNLPEASAHALREFQGNYWLYTGDIGAMDEEGYITICDRSKDMLIVGGFKVFSVEVEGKLKELPSIALCALIGEPDSVRVGNDVVTLHVELTADAKNRDRGEVEKEIMTFSRTNMAPYKVPKKIYFHDALPLTPVGKLDKKALRKK